MAATRKCFSTDDEFRQALSHIGPVPAGGNYKTVHDRIKLLALDTSHFTGAGWN